MSVSWQINPSDNTQLNFNSNSGNLVVKTVTDVKAQMISKNFDICVCLQTDYGSSNAYDMHMFGYDDTNPIYLADKDYLESSNNTVGCNRIPQGQFNQYTRYLFATNGTIYNQTGMQKNNVTSEKEVGGKTYRYVNSAFIKVDYPPVIIIAERESYPKDVYLNGVKASEQILVGKGGGATHVAKVTGHLSALSNNLSDILVVAAGGGGSAVRIVNNVETDKAKGGHGGGYVGGNPFLNNTEIPNMGGNQSTGFDFGLGQDMSDTAAGGGGGLYGGYSVQQAGIIHSTIQAVKSLVESTFNESVAYSKVTT